MAPKKDGQCSVGDGNVVPKWDDKKIAILFKVCVEEIHAGNRPNTLFTEGGWEYIEKKFQERTGDAYDRTQLKNIWDALKTEFSSFENMVEKVSGVGSDHDTQAMRAADEWSTAKGGEDREILKWKNEGPKSLELREEGVQKLENRIEKLERVVGRLKAARFGPNKGEIGGANAKP